MFCLKCGKETKGEQVFCDSCLQVMDAYPVRSDAPIHLPNRTEPQPPKKASSRKRSLPPEEQIQLLKTTNRRLALTVLGLAVALGICASAFIYHLITNPAQQAADSGNPGKNYTYSPD